MTKRKSLTAGGTLLTAFLMTSYGAAQTLTTLHSFPDGPGDGASPVGNLAVGSGGVLYGVTANTGVNNPASYGTVYSLTPPATPGDAWTETVLHTFSVTDGDHPTGGITIGDGGILYGTTYQGGSSNQGVAFSLTPPASAGAPWTETILHSFAGGSDGSLPESGLALGAGGVLYGTTYSGGSSCDCGTVFALVPPASAGDAWTEHVLLRFEDGNGSYPSAGIVIGQTGVLYGASSGTVFSLTPPSSPGSPWNASTIYTGTGAQSLGFTGLTLGNGVLYGTSVGGGNSEAPGTIFSLAPPATAGDQWTWILLHAWETSYGGYYPRAPVTFAPRTGVLYGTTNSGGKFSYGVLFAMQPPSSPGGSWAYARLHQFGHVGEAAFPEGAVLIYNSVLYGTASADGMFFGGSVYSFTP